MYKISVITVCFNAEKTIEKTIISVLNQSYRNFDFIIIDGKSTDRTMEIVDKYKKIFLDSKIKLTVVSEKDSGIYNAMNKSIPLAQGEWLLFLNADDYLIDSNVLSRVSVYLNEKVADVVYGDAIFKSEQMYKYFKSKPFDKITTEQVFCHQSVFFKKNAIVNFLYDEKYLVCADMDLFVKMYLNKYKFYKIDFPICFFSFGGLSTNSSYNKICNLDIADILHKNGLIDDMDYNKRLKMLKKNEFKQSIKNIFKFFIPKSIRLYKKSRYYKTNGWSIDIPDH